MTPTILRKASEGTLTPMLCKHVLTGDAPANKACVNCYDCARCEYDQMLEDTAHLVFRPVVEPGRRIAAAA
jgi:hypothetical protein